MVMNIVMKMYGEGTPKTTSQANLAPAYLREKTPNHGRGSECTCAQMSGKSPDLKFEIWFSTWNVGMSVKLKGYIFEGVLVIVVCNKLGGKVKGPQ